MQIKTWPLLAIVLILGACLGQRLWIAHDDFEKANAPQVSSPAATPTPPNLGMVQVTVTDDGAPTAAPRSLVAQAQLDPVPADPATDTPTDPSAADADVGWLAFVKGNLISIVLAIITLLEVIVRLTPTERDNSILSAIKGLIDKFIPNRRIGGGVL